MTDIAAFLKARLDEDRDRAADMAAKCAAMQRPAVAVVGAAANLLHDLLGWAATRLEREVEAKRKILDRLTMSPPQNLGQHLQWSQEQMGLLFAAEALASAYSDHPDYDPAWSAA